MGAIVAAEGTWIYGDTAEMPVWIIRADFDFWYEIGAADETLEPGERPELNDEGHRYYLSFRGLDDDGKFWPDGIGSLSLEDAQQEAEGRVPTPIRWR